jgi:hypothetical protein
MKITLGWQVGKDDWAFLNLVNHVIKALPEFTHKINEPGDIDILLFPGQLKGVKESALTVLHLDGNRWYEDTKSYI